MDEAYSQTCSIEMSSQYVPPSRSRTSKDIRECNTHTLLIIVIFFLSMHFFDSVEESL